MSLVSVLIIHLSLVIVNSDFYLAVDFIISNWYYHARKEVLILTINKRIKAIRKERHWSQTHLASILGVTQGGVSYMEQDGSTVSEQTIKSLCMAIPGLSESWLKTGSGPMYIENSSFDLTQYALDRGCDALELEILKAYFSLPKDIRKAALEHFKKCLATPSPVPAPDQSVEELEEEYKKRHSASASTTDSTASSTTTDAEKAAGD